MPSNLDSTTSPGEWRGWSLLPRLSRLRDLHRDQAGTISVLSVITLLMLTLILGQVLNAGRQVDDKLKLQNGIDAAGYSGGVIMARGMNSLAFTNHLLAEFMGMTAYMREGRDRGAESLVPQILDAWATVDDLMRLSQFAKIRDIAPAIDPRVRQERELVTAFGEMTAVKSRTTLPVLEYILGLPEQLGGNQLTPQQQKQVAATHLIPVFQRAVVQTIPPVVQIVVRDIARRHGKGQSALARSGTLQTIFWRTIVAPVGYPDELDPHVRSLPALDPAPEGPDFQYLQTAEAAQYMSEAIRRRNQLAHHYLNAWIDDRNFDLGPFERESYGEGGRVSGKMSQFKTLWRGFTCAKLNRLLNIEYPITNLPHMIRKQQASETQQQFLDRHFTFVAVSYRPQMKPVMPGVYRAPFTGDALNFSQVQLYIPRPRYLTGGGCPTWYCPSYDWRGTLSCGTVCSDRWPVEWSLFNQHWAAKLMPAGTPTLAEIIQTSPGAYASNIQLPNLGGMTTEEIKSISPH